MTVDSIERDHRSAPLPRPGFSLSAQIKALLPRGLYGRSLIIIVAPMVLLQLVVSYVFLERHWQMVTEKLSASVVADIALLTRQYEILSDPKELQLLTEAAWKELDMSVAFRPNEGLPAEPAEPGNFLLEQSLRSEIEERVARPFWIDTVSYSDYVDIRIAVNGGVLRVLPLRSRVYATNSHIFLVWMAGTSLVLLAVAVIFLRNQIRPIQRLAQAAEGFGKGRDVPDFRPQGASEVRRAAAAFLNMRERIQRQIDQRTAMLAGVSHDLRTPLTRFKLQLAMLGDGPEVQDLRADVKEMERMLEAYLAFAKGDQDEAVVDVDIAALLEEIRFDAGRNGDAVDVSAEGDLTLPLRRHAFKRCLTNLIENGCKYADHVTVTAQRAPHLITIFVDDDGEGVPEDQYEEVFRPFHRLDQARNLDEGGTGLGLAIARDVARSHGGDIVLMQSPLGGLRAQITLPV